MIKPQLTAVCLLLLISVATCFAQTKTVIDRTKLNGIWVFDAKASKADSYTKERYQGQDLTITYVEPELTITEPRTRDGETRYAKVVFFTDGRGEVTNPIAFNQDAEFESVTKWENDIIIRRYSIPIKYNGNPSGKMYYVEKYSLSEDGLTLTIIKEFSMNKFASDSLFGRKQASDTPEITTRVYRKK